MFTKLNRQLGLILLFWMLISKLAIALQPVSIFVTGQWSAIIPVSEGAKITLKDDAFSLSDFLYQPDRDKPREFYLKNNLRQFKIEPEGGVEKKYWDIVTALNSAIKNEIKIKNAPGFNKPFELTLFYQYNLERTLSKPSDTHKVYQATRTYIGTDENKSKEPEIVVIKAVDNIEKGIIEAHLMTAIDRAKDEKSLLKITPKLYDWRIMFGKLWLVEEYIDGHNVTATLWNERKDYYSKMMKYIEEFINEVDLTVKKGDDSEAMKILEKLRGRFLQDNKADNWMIMEGSGKTPPQLIRIDLDPYGGPSKFKL